MKYPCGIIRDLLPLYHDEVCNDESKSAVERHLSECEECRRYYNAMKSENTFAECKEQKDEEKPLINSLKSVKRRINRRNKIIIACSFAAIAMCFLAFEILFNVPLKKVDLDDVSVSANVYPMGELAKTPAPNAGTGVKISSHENDGSESYTITFPELFDSEITVTQDVMEKNGYVSVISWSSSYFLREIKYDADRNENGGVLYVTAFKTTVLNNKAQSYNQKIVNLEMKKISKIVYVEDDGTEKILWENK